MAETTATDEGEGGKPGELFEIIGEIGGPLAEKKLIVWIYTLGFVQIFNVTNESDYISLSHLIHDLVDGSEIVSILTST